MKENINITTDQKEMIIREGKAIDIPAPINLVLSGTIETPRLFLTKRLIIIDHLKSNICVNYEKMGILLTVNENNAWTKALIEGKIEMLNDYKKYEINTGTNWTPHALADFMKMNRSDFESKEAALKLINQLNNFTAKVNKELESTKDDRANYSLKRRQIVETNLPESFLICVRIFKGMKPVPIIVEVSINPETLNCVLISPSVNDYIHDNVEIQIAEEIAKIALLAPEIVIIEQ